MLFFIFLLPSVNGWASVPVVEDGTDVATEESPHEIRSRAEAITCRLIKDHLPQLSGYKISVGFFQSWESAIKSSFRPQDLFLGPKERHYKILISRRFFKNMPSWQAIEVVLLHELYHVLDYVRMSAPELRNLILKISLNKKFIPRYERCTDYRSLLHGRVDYMLDYRQWQQAFMSPKVAQKKLRNYFTPEELRTETWKNFDDCPIEAAWD